MKLFILLTLVSMVCYQAASASPDIKKYYDISHNATIYAVKGEYEKASAEFEKAFTYIRIPFIIEINNAIYAEVHRQNPDVYKINKYLNWRQNKGACIHEGYKKYPYLNDYISSLSHDDCSKVLNKPLYNTIHTLIESDQKVRNLHPQGYHSSVLPAIKTQDSINYFQVERILYYCLKNNVQIEEEIGMFCQTHLSVILLHGNPWGFHNKTLVDSLCTLGLIDNRLIADYSDAGCHGSYDHKTFSDWKTRYNCQKSSNIYGTLVMFISKKALLVIPPQKEIDRLNTIRAHIYLQDIIDVRKFQIFEFLNNDKNFSYPYKSILSGDKQTEDEFIKAYSLSSEVKVYEEKQDFNFD